MKTLMRLRRLEGVMPPGGCLACRDRRDLLVLIDARRGQQEPAPCADCVAAPSDIYSTPGGLRGRSVTDARSADPTSIRMAPRSDTMIPKRRDTRLVTVPGLLMNAL